jgi:hypothetical protein
MNALEIQRPKDFLTGFSSANFRVDCEGIHISIILFEKREGLNFPLHLKKFVPPLKIHERSIPSNKKVSSET